MGLLRLLKKLRMAAAWKAIRAGKDGPGWVVGWTSKSLGNLLLTALDFALRITGSHERLEAGG